ncbi:MAG: M42 family metallopeptidase [Clostridiales bacterium]|nr:M42 family metallopeptidase [Clostridiales bacterium]
MDLRQTLFSLSELQAGSGQEFRAAKALTELFAPYCDSVETDALENVIAIKRSEVKDAPTLLIDAHTDEICMVVTEVRKDGFLSFNSIGGIDRRTILSSEVMVHAKSGDYYGIVAALPPHLSTEEERKKTPELEKLCIDVGFDGPRAAELFSVGDFVSFVRRPCALMGGAVTGKTFDDRASVVAILSAFYALRDTRLPFHVAALLSAQEEVGLRGAKVGAYGIDPDEAIVIDVCHAAMPDCPKERTSPMGKGPVVTFSPILDRRMTETLIEVAEACNIPLQTDVSMGTTGTNAHAVFNVRQGVPTALLELPLRYMHTTVETIDMKDLANTGRLLKEYMLHKKEEMTRA